MKKHTGFTLIEVLIALAIISIAMAAIIKATTQNIRATSYLQDKTMALLVGQQVLNEVRVGVLQLRGDDQLKQNTLLLGRNWSWQANQADTPNQRIKKVEVEVYADANENDDETPLIHLESYIYVR